MIKLLAFLLLFTSTLANAKQLNNYESYFQEIWCYGVRGVTEYRLPDKTRVDCLTGDFAIEFDWGNKWAEAIGQSLWYASQTGKKAGIVLILKKPSDIKYYYKILEIKKEYNLPITIWVIEKDNYE